MNDERNRSRKAPALADYVAGAALANSLAWLTLGVIAILNFNPNTAVQLLFLMYPLGAVVAGFLVSRKLIQDDLKVGLKTGIGAFVLHIYVFMGVLELIWGTRVLFLGDHILILGSFILGGLAGAFLYSRFLYSRSSQGLKPK
ncbi:MAG: hypothetical protein JSV05_00350 [Candidatus Bathyarchaeota archaeon]|nr:MAG: hypothetical protein JSV05_00350 [Candidatus Bathyarchaeota archaeon]